MRGTSSGGVWKQLDGLFRFGAAGPLSDEELLGRFVARRDEAAEAAFAALVERHGPMVLGVCRRVLGDRHQAEDAFQATFLVLTRKASTIARRGQLANWLFGVACRTALGARTREMRRKAREQRGHAIAQCSVEPASDEQADLGELRGILDEELARLPDRYRGALVLCELEGLSRRAAARRLGIPEGTLASRIARAKDVLRARLARRGLALSTIALNAGLAREAEAGALVISSSFIDSTTQAAMHIAAGACIAEVASTSVASLTQGVLKAMLLSKSKAVILGLATAAVITTGFGVVAQQPVSSDGDRLSVLERKLDQILEALGGPRQSELRREGFVAPKEARPVGKGEDLVLPKGDRPAGKSEDLVLPKGDWPAGKAALYANRLKTQRGRDRFEAHIKPGPAVAKGIPDEPRNVGEAYNDAGPAVAKGIPDEPRNVAGPFEPPPPSDRTAPDHPPFAKGGAPAPRLSGTVAERMDTFERRLAELERRINNLERWQHGSERTNQQ
jgi:RNA polymerase sigma factor (sigma-70 family)